MLTNKEIKQLLQNNRGDLLKFARFLNMTTQGLYKRLNKEGARYSLDGIYKEFAINQKRK